MRCSMKLSVCMIVKDEENVISRALESVRGFADEIVVVDTGSTDKTVDIVRRYTDKVYFFEWRDDFSAARNYSFSMATGDYIMWLDADDTINKSNIIKINKLKENANKDLYYFKYAIAFDNESNPTFEYYRERLVSRAANYRWVGRVHEVIVPRGSTEYCDITIEHHKAHVSDPKRNLKIYNRMKREGNILNAREQYYYAKELYYNHYYFSACRELKKYLNMHNLFEPNKLDAIVSIARCMYMLKQYSNAIRFLHRNMLNNSPNVEVYFELANCYLALDDNDNAIFYYEASLNISKPIESGAFIDSNYYYLYQYLQLCALYYRKKDYLKAKKYHNLALKHSPNNEIVIFNSRFFME